MKTFRQYVIERMDPRGGDRTGSGGPPMHWGVKAVNPAKVVHPFPTGPITPDGKLRFHTFKRKPSGVVGRMKKK